MTSEARASAGNGGDLQRPRRSELERGSGRAGPGGGAGARAGGRRERPGPAAPGTGGEARDGRAQHPPSAVGPAPGMAERAKTVQVLKKKKKLLRVLWERRSLIT